MTTSGAPGAEALHPAYLRSGFAPRPRTLVDIFRETVAECPDVPAIDNGATSLTYAEFDEAASAVAEALHDAGVRVGDKVGVRVRSGTVDLYVAIMGILLAGAAYVPVDADDPDERARTVFEEAAVTAIVVNDLVITTPSGDTAPGTDNSDSSDGANGTDHLADPETSSDSDHAHPHGSHEPTLEDDAWVIFTSGSTGKPKGVAVTHRNAAAFVDAESRMFLQDNPIGVGDRVMAGLSVAFDASCEEMWLAWRYGACLVPAPRALVRSGVDLGPWLVANDVTIVSTVPTLVALWPVDALARVRLLIMGGEACPPELAERLATPTREVWNTYGPTEATVVACGARLTGHGPVRIGLPLDGWDLAVVDGEGMPVAEGDSGELIIGGVGLARYLDPEKDAEKYAPMPTIGWERAYRSGDLVRLETEGLLFLGRADDQVKVGGRRIELGEIDSALLRLPGVTGAAAAVRATTAGTKILVGYVTVEDGEPANNAAHGTAGASSNADSNAGSNAKSGNASSPAARHTTPLPRSNSSAPNSRPRWSRASPWSTPCRPAPPARSTATPSRGRSTSAPTNPHSTSAAPRRGFATSGSRSLAPTRRAWTTTSLTSAAAVSRRPSSCRGCAPGSRPQPSPTSTTTRDWPTSPPSSTRRRPTTRTATIPSTRCRARLKSVN
ncbi:MAG: amino acid adenylation domain-containing protein [Actinomycetales bacterium]|nr:amino acid adenylation domain-containing protein [Actinomycetales bacterium]